MSYVYFDIETTGLDIVESNFTCGVTIHNDTTRCFYDPVEMASYLTSLGDTVTPVTFNGLAFDYQFLAQKVREKDSNSVLLQSLATSAVTTHVDIMYAFLCDHGYFASMQSFATPLGVEKSWSGKEAATSTDQAAIAAYCAQDVAVLKQIHERSLSHGMLERVTTRGIKRSWVVAQGIPTVQQSMFNAKKSMPDQSWMDSAPDIAAIGAWAA